MTLAKKLGFGALTVVLALMACVAWMLATESGARSLLARAQPYLPHELTLGELRGSLIGGIDIVSVDWNAENIDVAIRNVSVEVELAQLLFRHVAVQSLDVAEIEIDARAAADTESEGGLPSVDLPLHISIDSSSLKNISYTSEDVSQDIDDIRISGSMKGSRLDVTQLVVQSSWLDADLAGYIVLAGDYPGQIQLNWKWSTSPSLELDGLLHVRGDLRGYDIEHVLRRPRELSTTGLVSYVDGALEFDLANTWAALEWPIEGSLLTSTGGTLKLAGSPGSFDVSLDTRAGIDDFPETHVVLEGVMDPEKIRITRLDASSELGRLATSGDVRWQPVPAFDLTYTIEELDPSRAYAPLTGQVSARGEAIGEWIGDDPTVTVVLSALEGRVNDQPLGGGGTFELSGDQVTASNGHVQLGGNRIGVSGTFGDRLQLDVQVELPTIGELLPDTSGSLSANLALRGSRERPEARLEMSGSDLSWSEFAVAGLNVDAAVLASNELVVNINLENALVGDSKIDSVDLAASGTLDRHDLRAEIRDRHNRIVAETAGAYVDGDWSGSVRSLRIDNAMAGTWSLREPAELVVTRDAFSISRACLDQAVETGHACIQAASAPDRSTTFDLVVNDLPLSALPLGLPADVIPSGFVDVRAEGSVIENRLTSEVSTSLRDARIDGVVDDETISAAFTTATADISVIDNRAVASLQLELADGIGDTMLELIIDDVMDTGSVIGGRGMVEINDLSLFAVLLPDVAQPRGTIAGSLDISGTMGEPELTGAIELSDGGFGFRRTGIEISNIDARVAQLSAGRLQLEGSARSGDGEIAIRGDTWVDAETGIRSEFLITGNDFELSRLPDWQVAASPSISVIFDDRVTTVSGNLFIPATDVRVKDIPDTAASASSDAVVHRGGEPGAAARRRIDVDIAVGMGEDVRFAGFGLSTGIEGAVRVRGGTHAPYTGSGRLSLRDGRYKAYGQDLEIERGQLIFNGPLDNPQLDVRAVRRMTDVTAGIAISGTPSQLRSSLFSEPPLGDAETLSYLLTGRPLSRATGEGDGDMLSSAAFALGVSSAGNIVTQVRSGLGLDTLAVEGGADDGRLIAGKRFGNRLMVEYGYGLIDKLGTLLLRYQLSDRIILESRTGMVSNFDVLYRVKKQ